MTRFASIGLAAFLVVAPALGRAPVLAQAAAPPTSSPSAATPPAPPVAEAHPDGGADGKPAIKAVRAGCRDEAKVQGLKGEARQTAISACVVKARPELAAREQCRSDGRAKGLRKEELHAFVMSCVKPKA